MNDNNQPLITNQEERNIIIEKITDDALSVTTENDTNEVIIPQKMLGSGQISELYEQSGRNDSILKPVDEGTGENVQKSTIFSDDFSNILVEPSTIAERVSDFDTQSTIQNSRINSNFQSKNDESILFSRLFPGVTPEMLEKDENFKLFCEKKEENASICSLYGNYLSLVKKISDNLALRNKCAQNNSKSSPGALSSPESAKSQYYTREQVLKMSREQIAKNYDKIRASQQKW